MTCLFWKVRGVAGEEGWKARKLQQTGGGSLFFPLGALASFALVWSHMSGFPGMTKEEENGSCAGKETDFSLCVLKGLTASVQKRRQKSH